MSNNQLIEVIEGLSNDGRRLYLLEWISPGRYHVRKYDLAAGRLAPDVIAEKGAPSGSSMSGEAVSSLATADGLAQVTLYQRNAEGHALLDRFSAPVIGKPFELDDLLGAVETAVLRLDPGARDPAAGQPHSPRG